MSGRDVCWGTCTVQHHFLCAKSWDTGTLLFDLLVAELLIKSPPLRPMPTPSTPHLCTRGHKEDLASVLSYACCWHPSTSTTAEDLLSCLQGRWKRFGLWSQSSPTLATVSYVQVFARVCKKEDGQGQRCPGWLLTWMVGTVGADSPLAPPSWRHLPKCIPKAGQKKASLWKSMALAKGFATAMPMPYPDHRQVQRCKTLLILHVESKALPL